MGRSGSVSLALLLFCASYCCLEAAAAAEQSAAWRHKEVDGAIEEQANVGSRRSLQGNSLSNPCALSACFLMDQSGSMHPDQWAQVRSFVSSAASVLSSKSKGASVFEAVKFDTNVQSVIPTLTNNVKAFQKQVIAAKQNKGGTFTSAGLDRCRSMLAKTDKSKPRVIVLVTDGKPNLPAKNPDAATLASAKAAKAAGITIFSVGVKDNPKDSDSTLNPTLLRAVASRSTFFFSVNDFKSLATAVQMIVPKICTANKSGKYPTPKPTRKPTRKPTKKPTKAPTKAPTPPMTCPGWAMNAEFDDLNATISGDVAVPTNYMSGSVNWVNWNTWDSTAYQQVDPTSGFATGVESPNNTAFNNFAQPATLATNDFSTLTMNFFYGTAGFPDASPLAFNVTGYDNVDNPIAFQSFVADVAGPTLFYLNANFTGVTTVKWETQNPVSPTNKQQLVVDNVCFAVIPHCGRIAGLDANGNRRTAC